MKPKLFIGWSMMLYDVSLLSDSAKETVMVVARKMFVDELHCLWYLLAVHIKPHIVQHQVEDVPASGVMRLRTNSVFSLMAGCPAWPSIGLESFFVA